MCYPVSRQETMLSAQHMCVCQGWQGHKGLGGGGAKNLLPFGGASWPGRLGCCWADLTNVVMDITAKQRFAAAFVSMTVREQRPSSPDKGATGRVRTGDQRYCQLGQD